MATETSQSHVTDAVPLWVNRIRTLEAEPLGKSARELLEEWKVHPHLVNLLEEHHINQLFPVQEQVIPLLIDCDALDRYSVAASDIVVTAPTGQGKTLCYLLPIVNSIVKNNRIGLVSLILAPTRELVKQIYDFCKWFIEKDTKVYDLKGGELLRVYSCHGNTSFIDDHTYLLEKRPQIVVFTPGRFVEHFAHREAGGDKTLDFSSLRWIVIDEVDLLLSQSFYNWTSAVISISNECQRKDAALEHTFHPVRPQKILVSATIPTKSSEIDLLQLNRPLLLKGNSSSIYTLPENLQQWCIKTTKNKKPLILIKLMLYIMKHGVSGDKTIIFCSYKETAHETARMLELFSLYTGRNLGILELSANLSQKQRREVLEKFGDGTADCLVCSDVASRGMNFAKTRNVINYDFPKSITKYIHRIGRTARANESGSSYMILTGNQESELRNFVVQLQIAMEDIKQIVLSDLLESKNQSELDEDFKKIRDMVDRCLELEKSGTIQHDAPMTANWMALLQNRDAE
ncbi:ATP-dependent RNA helicase [Babesia ovis]|uniref:ATP-dependent RNA helicase n=1 Tax=Babesia ovis TaxID=5869 RepID=A0A9W5WUC7_BABOV|nr:ATP-dependent RNA helicase [Babesia ovis]